MIKTNSPDPELDHLLKRSLKDDLPPEAETRMQRQFLRFKRTLGKTEQSPEPNGWFWMRGPLRREILALASAAMIILGLMMQLGGSQGALAHSIERLKVIATVSSGLHRASAMDCMVLKSEVEGGQTSYRIRWHASEDVRIEMVSAESAQTLWILNNTIAIAGPGDAAVRSMPIDTMTPGPAWQPALEFLSPEILAANLEERYGLMHSSGRTGEETNTFLILGRQERQDIEITIDEKTYLPKVLKKYALDPGQTNGNRPCLMEVRFIWNQPIITDLFIPGPQAEKP